MKMNYLEKLLPHHYNPSHQKYQGDEKLRVVTQMSRVIRKRKKEQNETAGGRVATRTPKNKEDASTVESSSLITPTYAQYLAAKRTSRFCNTSMTGYCKHQNSVQLVKMDQNALYVVKSQLMWLQRHLHSDVMMSCLVR